MDYFRKLIFIILILFINLIIAESQNSPDTVLSKTGGLKFASKDVYSSQRTSLRLFDGFRHVSRSFDLRFTCDIYDPMFYGFVFRVMNDFQTSQSAIMHLIYIPPQGNTPDCSFEFHFYQSEKTIVFKLDTLELKDISFEIIASVRENLVTIKCNDSIKESSFEFPRAMNINFLFGLYGENTDVAPMVLHNIRLTLNNQNRFFWPLNELSGNQAKERIERIQSEVQNPIWLQDRHYYWEKLITVNTDPMAGIVFDDHNRLLFINKDSLLIYDPGRKRWQALRYNSVRPFERDAFFSVYNPKTGQIIAYDFRFLRTNDGRRVFSVYDPDLNTWTLIDSSDLADQNHHHSVFWNIDTTKLVTFGGYSYFRYYNKFREFEFDSARWEDLSFTGDEVFPRTHSAVSRSRYNGRYYLYGGFGNKEGSQSMEGKYFYDLYEISPENHTITRLWNLNAPEFDFVPRGNLVYYPDGEVCYVLGNPHIEKSNLRLYEISLKRPEIKVVSDSIPVIFSNMSANAYLFHNRERNELYCITRETTNNSIAATTVYRLNFPPAGIQENPIISSKKPVLLYVIIAISLFILFVGVTWYILKKRKKKKALVTHEEIGSPEKFERKSRNAIWLLNEFRVFDLSGHDISYRFATKVRHAFLLLFFENYYNNGITSEDFSNLLWPALNKNQQKNNRGVIMNNLRKIFEDLNNIKLIKENQHWKLMYGDDLYIDFPEIHKILVLPPTEERIETIINYFALGNLLSNENWEYIDKYKDRYSSAAIEIMLEMNKNAFQTHNHLKCIEISDIILNYFDFLNEPAIIYKIKSLYILKNSSKAVTEYNKFRLRYNESISKPFHLTFDDILKTTVPPENY